jgi:hypothetical protein
MSLLNLTNNHSEEPKPNYVFSTNTILIPKSKFSQLKKDFGFFDAFIDRNFSNSGEYFDEKGNYILKKELLPEEMVHYDKNSDDMYIIKRNDVWNALPKALSDYHIPNKVLGDYMAEFFIFKKQGNSLFNPTVPEQNTVSKPSRVYYAGPSLAQLKKQRREARDLDSLRREIYGNAYFNNNLNNEYPYRLFTPFTENQLRKFIEEDKRKNKINEIKIQLRKNKNANVEELSEALQEIYKNRQLAHALYHTEKAMANRTKYGKESETRRKPLSETKKEKRRTLRRKKQRARKTAKHSRANNNENGNGNYGNGNNENNEYY